jgi:hypothetical protein
MVRKWSTGPISLSYTTHTPHTFNPLYFSDTHMSMLMNSFWSAPQLLEGSSVSSSAGLGMGVEPGPSIGRFAPS